MILSNKLQTVIEVDGGVKLENAKKLFKQVQIFWLWVQHFLSKKTIKNS